MLPLLVISLLVSSLYAAPEFPKLMQGITVTWDNVDITSQIDSSFTTSVDGQAPFFIFCGPFQSSGKDGRCTGRNDYSLEDHGGRSDVINTAAKLLYSVNETYSCMSVGNGIPNFPDLYQKTQEHSGGYVYYYSADYRCHTQSYSTMIILIAVGAVVLLAAAAFISFKLGQKKANKEMQDNAYGSVVSGTGRY